MIKTNRIFERLTLVGWAALICAGVAGPLAAQPAPQGAAAGPAMTAATPLGTILVGPSGKTLYTWDRDVAAKTSVCFGSCAENWPPFLAEAGAVATGEWTIVTRADGKNIWAFQGKPLYYFAHDANPGDTNGNNPTGAWHVVLVGM